MVDVLADVVGAEQHVEEELVDDVECSPAHQREHWESPTVALAARFYRRGAALPASGGGESRP